MLESIQNDRAFCLVLHDIAPATWGQYADFVAEVDRLGPIPLTLLVVPDYHRQGALDRCRPLVEVLQRRLEQGDELVLHGCYHEDPGPIPPNPKAWLMRRVYTREGELYAIGEAQARERLERGMNLFKRLGWPLRGFVPPAWLLGPGARKALRGSPFAYTSDPGHLILLPEFAAIPAPTLVWSARSPWRRLLSRQWNEHLLRRNAEAPLLRLGVHPVDLRHASARRYWLETLERILTQRVPVTKSAWLGLD
jgi:predicted deacetylase